MQLILFVMLKELHTTEVLPIHHIIICKFYKKINELQEFLSVGKNYGHLKELER